MRTKRSPFAPAFKSFALGFVIAVGCIATAMISTRTVFNTTSSLDQFFIKISMSGDRGSYVSFCSPVAKRDTQSSGFCPDGSMPLVKRIVGIAGDIVKITPEAVVINGSFKVPNSEFQAVSSTGQVLTMYSCPKDGCVLKEGQLWVAGDFSHSYDSRYYGPINIKDLH